MAEINLNVPTAFIYGSCVSRDIPRLYPNRLQSAGYIARQSWISAFSEPTPLPGQASALTSAFQQRMVELDLCSAAPECIRTEAQLADRMVLDLIDERYGVLPTTSGGFVTNSFELIGSRWKSVLASGELIHFGTSQHFDLWVAAAEKMVSLLSNAELLTRACVIKVDYATHTDEGEYLGERRGYPVEKWNDLFAPYYEWVEASPIRLVNAPKKLAITRHDHEWGKEPFHYIDEYYAAIADLLDNHFGLPSGS